MPNEPPPTTLGGPASDSVAPRSPQAQARTPSTPELFLVIAFVALVFAVPLIQCVYQFQAGTGNSLFELFRRKPTAANLRAFERSLEDDSVVGRAVRPLVQFAQFAWLADGAEKALVGRDGWLFYKPGHADMVARHDPALTATNDPLRAIVAYRDDLAARGIQLLVLPVPNKESIYPDKVSRRIPEGKTLITPSTRDLLNRLQAAGVQHVNLFELFAEARRVGEEQNHGPLYLQQDSHWSPAGLALVARAVSEKLNTLGWVSPPARDYEARPVQLQRLGDVLRMFRNPSIEKSISPEIIACEQVLDAASGQLYKDDPASEVLVLGDSFLRIFEQDEPGSAGFVAHLARELGRPLTSLVNDGGASTLVRQELFRRPALLKHKRVVIWEFVERDIHLGTEGWQSVPLPR